jgi:hypothetical protein
MNEELTPFIIKELGRHHSHKEIVEKICRRSTLNWTEAEQLVVLVEAQHRRVIASRQTPLLLFISVGTLILGIGLLAMNLQVLAGFTHKDLFAQVLTAQSSYYRIIALVTGLGMTGGGLVGLWRALGAIFPE